MHRVGVRNLCAGMLTVMFGCWVVWGCLRDGRVFLPLTLCLCGMWVCGCVDWMLLIVMAQRIGYWYSAEEEQIWLEIRV